MATGVDAGYLLHIIANGAEKTFPVLRDGFSLMAFIDNVCLRPCRCMGGG